MNHATVPKFANPHFFSQGYERTSRAEHTKETEILAEDTQDETTDSILKRKLDELLHESWTDVLQNTQAIRNTEQSRRGRKHRNTAVCDSDTSGDDKVSFRLLSSTSNPRPIHLRPKPQPVVSTREPEWEDTVSEAEERQRRAKFVAIFDSYWHTLDSPQHRAIAKAFVARDAFPVPSPSIMVTEENHLRMRAHSMLVSRLQTANPQPEDVLSPHELKTTCAPVITVQTSSGVNVFVSRSSRRCRRRKHEEKKPPPTYWKPPAGLRGKCMGYALGYPGNWGNTSASDGGYVRDVMKKGVYA